MAINEGLHQRRWCHFNAHFAGVAILSVLRAAVNALNVIDTIRAVNSGWTASAPATARWCSLAIAVGEELDQELAHPQAGRIAVELGVPEQVDGNVGDPRRMGR